MLLLLEHMPSSSSIKPDGTSQKLWRYRTILPCFHCKQNGRNSIRSRTSGNSCAITGSQTEYSNPTTTLLTIVASPGTNSSFNRGELCQSDYATGRINDSFCKLVLGLRPTRSFLCRTEILAKLLIFTCSPLAMHRSSGSIRLQANQYSRFVTNLFRRERR